MSIDSLCHTTSPSTSRACIAPFATRNQSDVAVNSPVETSIDQRLTSSIVTLVPISMGPVAPLPCSSLASKSSCHSVSAPAFSDITPKDNAPANSALTTFADFLSVYFCVLPSLIILLSAFCIRKV